MTQHQKAREEMSLIEKAFFWLLCKIGSHAYTSYHEMGVPIDKAKQDADPLGYFWEYTALRCKRCPYQFTSKLTPKGLIL